MADKKRTELDWEDLRYFAALAHHGSLSAAARQLGVNHATVARRLAALEACLGQHLFERRPQGYVLTGAGQRVLAASRQMEAAAGKLDREDAAKGEAGGIVRLTTIRSFADGFLVPHLAEFARQYPRIEIDLITESRNMSLDRREVDIALRFGRPQRGGFLVRHAGSLDFRLYATKRVRKNPEAGLITFDEGGVALPEAQCLKRLTAGRAVVFRSNSQTAQAAAAAAGMGMALLPDFLARHYPALVPVDLPETHLRRDIWLLIRKEQRQLRRIRLLADFLMACLQRNRPQLLAD
ncbi:MAG TPA: LysR family transcriptional regulator [Dongiaceae bacterium]|nr:LysR family transcriptional regulator [Dongiaceae bacterium]